MAKGKQTKGKGKAAEPAAGGKGKKAEEGKLKGRAAKRAEDEIVRQELQEQKEAALAIGIHPLRNTCFNVFTICKLISYLSFTRRLRWR
tara:strand:- start:113 stop:379 length:267 start_codon:yes stop_codon:yes gene_type:complete